jgi:hypothetical protein
MRSDVVADAVGHDGVLPRVRMARDGASARQLRGGGATGRSDAPPAAGIAKRPRSGMMSRRSRSRSDRPDDLPWIGSGKPGPHAWQGETSLFGCRMWNPAETKKARSSLLQAASPAENGVHRSPPAADRCSGFDGPAMTPVHLRGSFRDPPSIPGDRPASCPDVHRPARGHRHVRIWAGAEIG